MVSVYDQSDYRVFLKAWIKDKKQRGLQSGLAQAMSISTSLMSLILRGEKNLSSAQALDAAEFLELNERETDYFLLLVELGQAGSHKLQNRIKQKIHEAQSQAKKISHRVKAKQEISEEGKSIYYSSWIYTGIRNLTAIEDRRTANQISDYLKVSPKMVLKILEFLVENGLCVKSEQGYVYGPAHTHLGVDSPHANRHHQNWRHRAVDQMNLKNENDLFYTCPMSLSEKDSENVRSEILKCIEIILKIVGPSPSEVVRCVNFDFFEY